MNRKRVKLLTARRRQFIAVSKEKPRRKRRLSKRQTAQCYALYCATQLANRPSDKAGRKTKTTIKAHRRRVREARRKLIESAKAGA